MSTTSMALKVLADNTPKIVLGVCFPSLKHNASKICVTKLELDKSLLTFFPKKYMYFAHDPNKICKTGDIVLIEKLEKQLSTSITHKVLEVVYPLGDVVDPITNKPVVNDQYREEMEEEEILLGKSEHSFNYKKAPRRGWQEGKKDFSNREIYVKYHEFDEDDENKDQPYSSLT